MKKLDTTALALFFGLVGFGVLGRWFQPDWNFAPTAAVAAFAAWWFSNALVAALVPVAVMAISNLILDDYHGPLIALVVYGAYLVPLGIGRLLRRDFTRTRMAALCIVSPASFYLLTNFAHWALLHQYPHTWDGLVACYVAAIPFLQGTASGDAFYVVLLFGGYAMLAERLGRGVACARLAARG